jgi:hypothetical protein
VFSPKRLQKEGNTEEAFRYYRKRYRESLEDGDPFLSNLYLDEIAHTLIIENKNLSFEQLQQHLVKTAMLETLDEELKEQASLDIEVTLRKRFPGRFKEPDLDEGDAHG